MGAPVPGMEAVDDATAEALLSSLKTIAAAERRKHATVFNYWLSIRANREFPPIRDLDPLEISDAGPFSVLLEMIGAEDADIRHLGQAIKADVEVLKMSEAPSPSVLSCIASRIPVVVACRQPFAFEDEFKGPNGKTRCWVTLLPFSQTGTWIDYVYGFVSLDPAPDVVEEAVELGGDAAAFIEEAAEQAEESRSTVEETSESEAEPVQEVTEPEAEPVQDVAGSESDPVAQEVEPEPASEPEPEPEPAKSGTATAGKAGFSAKLLDSLASVGGFYGRNVQVEPELPAVPFATEEALEEPTDEPTESKATESKPTEPELTESKLTELELTEPEPTEPKPTSEGSMESKLTEVRAKADEARMAKLRSNIALYEGLSAAYDFALDAEDNADEYLKLVEAQGLKIQLRSPMKPVVRLAFDGMCDDSMIAHLEAVLAWALKMDLPRGSLAERIEAEGGIAPILNGGARAA
jgi:hypothetical protein